MTGGARYSILCRLAWSSSGRGYNILGEFLTTRSGFVMVPPPTKTIPEKVQELCANYSPGLERLRNSPHQVIVGEAVKKENEK